jgi:hypothetical protein
MIFAVTKSRALIMAVFAEQMIEYYTLKIDEEKPGRLKTHICRIAVIRMVFAVSE